MAPPPEFSLPAWATWAALLVLASVAALAVVASRLGRSVPDDAAMGPLGHVAELRKRLVRMVLGACVGVAIAFTVRLQAAAPFVSLDPYENLAAQVFRRLVADLVPDHVQLVVTQPTAGFVAMFYVALATGLLVSLPYVLGQLALFVGPALRPRERRTALFLVAPASLLFACGVLFAYVVVLPSTFTALYTFSEVLGAESLLDAPGFVSFTLMFLLLAGVGFQTPLVMFGLARVGLATPRGLLRRWRHALLAIVIIAAFVTPDPSPVSQVLLSLPLFGLYMLGALLAIPAGRAFERASRA